MNPDSGAYNGFDFEIEYQSRPVSPSALEKKRWVPTSSYSRTLKQIKEQSTPGELYRKYYIEFGRQENILKALDERTLVNYEGCARSVTLLQSKLRGNRGEEI